MYPGFWDPITAAQLSGGAFCCDALYYSEDGVGRNQVTYGAGGGAAGDGYPAGVYVANSAFIPPISGGDMATEASPGGMCPVSGTTKDGVSEYENPTETNLLEGQAFYSVMAGMQYNIPKPATVSATVTANAARQKKCAERITSMMKMNTVAGSTGTAGKDNTGADCGAAGAVGLLEAETKAITQSTVTQQYCRGTDKSAIQFPVWPVGVGAGTAGVVTKYNVPNGYCYANQCFEDFAAVATATSFSGKAKLGALVNSPDMSSNPTVTTTSCGRANSACAAAPTGWTGEEVKMEVCGKPGTPPVLAGVSTCTSAQIIAQNGVVPTV
jgi:hypothetical protein